MHLFELKLAWLSQRQGYGLWWYSLKLVFLPETKGTLGITESGDAGEEWPKGIFSRNGKLEIMENLYSSTTSGVPLFIQDTYHTHKPKESMPFVRFEKLSLNQGSVLYTKKMQMKWEIMDMILNEVCFLRWQCQRKANKWHHKFAMSSYSFMLRSCPFHFLLLERQMGEVSACFSDWLVIS